MSDVIGDDNGKGPNPNPGCKFWPPPCTDIGMKYGVVIGI